MAATRPVRTASLIAGLAAAGVGAAWQGVLTVLEVNAGMVSRLGIKTGDILQHPALGAEAIASCE